MEFKEGLKLIKETCKESLCINCPFDDIDGCILGDRHPEKWNVEEIGDRFIDVEDKMALEIDSVTFRRIGRCEMSIFKFLFWTFAVCFVATAAVALAIELVFNFL